jgi:hypothetical protein
MTGASNFLLIDLVLWLHCELATSLVVGYTPTKKAFVDVATKATIGVGMENCARACMSELRVDSFF